MGVNGVKGHLGGEGVGGAQRRRGERHISRRSGREVRTPALICVRSTYLEGFGHGG